MADRFLSELEWKRFSKANQVKDTALGKALAALETAKGPEGELKALDDMDKAVATLKKENKGSVEVTGWLESVGKSADKQRKESELALKKAAKEESDEEEDDPVLLTSKMIPLLRQVKKGDEVQVLVARGGREMAVLMSRKAISPSRRKMLADYLDDGTPKFHKGICIFEENAYTFVMDTPAGGMAKKLKAALLKQVELRVKVRVRGPEGDLDDDGEPAEDDGLEAEGEEGGSGKPEATNEPKQEAPKDAAQLEYEKRWPAAEKRALELLRAGTGDVSKLRAVVSFVQGKVEGGNYAAAVQGIGSLEKLMGVEGTVPTAPPMKPADNKPEAKGEADAGTADFDKRVDVLKKAIPGAVAAVPANREQARDIVLKLSEAGVFWRKGERDRPKAMLEEAETMFAALPKTATTGDAKVEAQAQESSEEQGEDGQQDNPKAAEYASLLAKLQPLYDKATSGGLSGEQQATLQKVTAAWGMAEESAADKNYDRAMVILRRLDEGGMLASLAGPRETGPTGDGRLVRQRKFMIDEWSKMPAELRGKLKALRSQLVAEEADEDPDGLVNGIADSLDDLLDGIQDDMDQAINEGTTDVFKSLRERARSHALIQHLIAAPGFDGGGLLASVEGALGRIEQAMLAE